MKLRYFYFSIFFKASTESVCKEKNTFELKGFSFLMHDSTKKVIIFLYIMTDQVPWINDKIIWTLKCVPSVIFYYAVYYS